MANAIYNKYKEALLAAANNASLVDGNLKISLIDSDQTMFSAGDEFYSELANTESILATTTLTNVSVTGGVLDADDVTFTAVTGNQAEALLLWVDTQDENTSRLVAWMDTGIDGLPITPDGTDIDIVWNTSGIFKL